MIIKILTKTLNIDGETYSRPMCHRCLYNDDLILSIDGEWICSDCLTDDEYNAVLEYINNGNIILDGGLI